MRVLILDSENYIFENYSKYLFTSGFKDISYVKSIEKCNLKKFDIIISNDQIINDIHNIPVLILSNNKIDSGDNYLIISKNITGDDFINSIRAAYDSIDFLKKDEMELILDGNNINSFLDKLIKNKNLNNEEDLRIIFIELCHTFNQFKLKYISDNSKITFFINKNDLSNLYLTKTICSSIKIDYNRIIFEIPY